MIILVDQDGVLADFSLKIGEIIQAHPVLSPHYSDGIQKNFVIEDAFPPELYEDVRRIYHTEGFFRNLPPIPGAIDGIKALRALGHEVRICTSPLRVYNHCVNEKYQWIEEHLGAEWTELMIPTRDKTLIRGDLLIDDNPQIKGLCIPEWEQVLFDAPYNRVSHISMKRMTWENWKEIISSF